ncbi:MAG: pyridoxal phosphate-dependent decarboxylase family protein [Rubripirellula sp.]
MDGKCLDEWIRMSYDSDFSLRCGEKLSQLFSMHLGSLQSDQRDFQTWVGPEDNVRHAESFLQAPGKLQASANEVLRVEGRSVADSASLVEQFEKAVGVCLQKSQGLHHPRCAGHQVPASLPLAGWFDALTSITNQVQGVYEMGPWSVAVERAVLNQVGVELGFEAGNFGALVTSGGSLANLTALLAARHAQFPEVWEKGTESRGIQPVVVVHEDAHYCIERAIGVMGLGTNQLVRVAVDDQRRMCVQALNHVLNDLQQRRIPVLAVVSVAGSTACGAFDSLPEVARVCDRYGVWLHVDAAHGGALGFSESHRSKLDGLELADSVVVDAHKMLFVPAVCAMLFFKEPENQFAAFDQNAPYLFDPSEPTLARYDNAVVTLECTKRASAIGLWGVWSIFGKAFFGALIDRVITRASELFQRLEQADDFEVWGRPECNIVLFSYRGNSLDREGRTWDEAFQLRLRRRLLEMGRGYLTQTKVAGRLYLRATIMNPMMTEYDLDHLLDEIRQAASEIQQPVKGAF